MFSRTPPSPPLRPGHLAHSPAVRRGGQWWLVADSGSVLATDPSFITELDRFAVAMAASDQVIADLRTQQGNPPPSRPGLLR